MIASKQWRSRCITFFLSMVLLLLGGGEAMAWTLSNTLFSWPCSAKQYVAIKYKTSVNVFWTIAEPTSVYIAMKEYVTFNTISESNCLKCKIRFENCYQNIINNFSRWLCQISAQTKPLSCQHTLCSSIFKFFNFIISINKQIY